MSKLYVTNSRGELEPFSFRKVWSSARRAGAPSKVATQIALTIQNEATNGIKTGEIFRKVKEMLIGYDYTSALRFNLKEAIKKLGPSGFPFEKFMAEVFYNLGYHTSLNQQIRGKCVSHEIDFIAENDSEIIIAECKYRISSGERVDVKNCLSNYAKFLDLKEGYFKNSKKPLSMFLITNAKFTNQAIKYGKCVGLELLGWRYPADGGIETMVESQDLYPVTILPSFKGILTNMLSSHGTMLVKDILNVNVDKLAKHVDVPKSKLLPLIDEAKILMEQNGKKKIKLG
ncbi:MAG: hypothetical protein WC309_00970 [Candidatus Paceibacterota bacterium]|jgi:hypothetical protein|nr:restriction endonuclease [Candidatus Paceibacterota bacterium]